MRKYFKLIVLSLIAVLMLWYFGRGLEWNEVIASVKRANPFLLLVSVLIICVSYVLRTLRWQTLLKPLSNSSLPVLFEATTVGYAALFLFGRAGEVVRPLWLSVRDHRIRPTAALVTIGVERFCDLFAIVVLFAINLIWFKIPVGREAEFAFVNQAGLLLLLATILIVLGLALFQRRSSFFTGLIDVVFLRHTFVPRRVSHQIHKILNSLVVSLSILLDARELIVSIFWTGLLWFAISMPMWLVIVAFELPLDFSDALFVMGWAVLGSLVPTPGGAAGAFHTATAGALIFLRINPETAAAASIIIHFVYFAPALIFGIYYFIRGEVTVAAIRKMILGSEADSDQEAENSSRPYAVPIQEVRQ